MERVAWRNAEFWEKRNSEFQEKKSRISREEKQKFKKGKAEFRRSPQEAGDKLRNKIKNIYVQSSPVVTILFHLPRGTKLAEFTKGPSVSHWWSQHQEPTEPPWSFSGVSFHRIVLSEQVTVQGAKFHLLSRPSTGMRSALVQHHCPHPWIELAAALGNQAKPAKIEGSEQKLEGNSFSAVAEAR